jgi:2-polyprenyl-3-methyl-5-hydroxy-6-metoxy-1,4-benzoquinol methylase
LQINPIPKEELSTIYPTNYYSFSKQPHNFINAAKEYLDTRLFKRVLTEIPGNDLKILDVGGGSGWLLDLIKQISNRIKLTQVVDLDIEAQKLATQNGHFYFCGKIEDFESHSTFDLIIMLNLIEHVEDPLAVMKNIEKLLSPSGRVLIKTPNYQSLDARIFKKKNWGGLHCPRHWTLFTKESVFKLSEMAGLKVKDFRYTQGAPFWAISILAWFKKIKLVKLSNNYPAYRHPLYKLLIALFAGVDIIRKPFAKTSQMFIMLSKN